MKHLALLLLLASPLRAEEEALQSLPQVALAVHVPMQELVEGQICYLRCSGGNFSGVLQSNNPSTRDPVKLGNDATSTKGICFNSTCSAELFWQNGVGWTFTGALTTSGSVIVGGAQITARSANFTQFTLGSAGNAVFNVDVNGLTSVQLGTGAGNTGTVPCLATVNTTAQGNAADTTEDNLQTYSLAGNSMTTNGKGVRYTAWGDGVSTADVTTVRCYFGATAVSAKVLTASQANNWHMVFEVIRTGAATQIASSHLENGGAANSVVQANATPAETLSGAVTIKCTGQRATTSAANSVRQLGGLVEFFN